MLDLALPRDIDAGRARLPGVTVVDLETLGRGARGRTEHAADVEATRAIVADEVAAFLGWQRAAHIAPTVVALRDMADEVVAAELARLDRPAARPRRPTQRAEIEQTVRRVVDKLLHAPTVRVKQLAERARRRRRTPTRCASCSTSTRRPSPPSPAPIDRRADADATDGASMTAPCGSAPGAARSPSPSPGRSPTRSPRATGRAVELVEVTTYGDTSREAARPDRRHRRVRRARCARRCCAGEVDFAVHSLKDLPTAQPDGLAARRGARRARTRATCWSPATG